MKKSDIILWIIAFIVIILVIFKVIYIPCVFNLITGYYCPGCGATRAVLALLHGDVYQAFRYNSIIFIDVPILLIICFLQSKFNNSKVIKIVTQVILILLAILTIAYGVLRNIPAFSYLAPQ